MRSLLKCSHRLRRSLKAPRMAAPQSTLWMMRPSRLRARTTISAGPLLCLCPQKLRPFFPQQRRGLLLFGFLMRRPCP
eukprot:g13881.t1